MLLCPPRLSPTSLALAVSVLTLSTGCALKTPTPIAPIDPEVYVSGTAYTYQPLNPTTIFVRDPEPEELKDGETAADITSPDFKNALLRDLDTETVRISLAKISGKASATALVVGASVAGESYELTIDYIKYFTSNKFVEFEYQEVSEDLKTEPKKFEGHVPIYAGVGVRIRAEFRALESGLNISGLPALALAASTNSISGRLTVQTMGITGPEITGLMPIIPDISMSSIQSAVQSLAAIKAKLYEDSTVVYPKIVGFESPSANKEAILKITEFLYGLEEYILPVVSPNPVKKDERLLWIAWFSDPPEE